MARAFLRSKEFGLDVEMYVEFDGTIATASFRDRGMAMAVTKAAEEGGKAIVCASTGNTSAAAPAYASRAGMRAFVLIPEANLYGQTRAGDCARCGGVTNSR